MESTDPKSLGDGPKGARITGFWRRLAAGMLDLLLLGTIGGAIGASAFDRLAALGSWGRFIGFAIALAYFVPLDSHLGGGQSVGKRLLRIRVADRAGLPIGAARAALRFAVLAIPSTLNGASFRLDTMPPALLQLIGGSLLGLIVLGAGTSILYLFVFNRRTRQSLHDLVTDTLVVDASPGAPPPARVWPGHLTVVGVLCVAALALPLLPHIMGTWVETNTAAMRPLFQTVQATPGVGSAVVTANMTKVWLNTSGTHTGASVNVVAILDRRPDSLAAAANRIAEALLMQHAAEIGDRLLRIHVSYGFDLGIASWRNGYTDARTVTQWRAKLRGAP